MTRLVEVKHETNYTLIQMDDGKANALGFDMLEQLTAALDEAERSAKVLVVCGRPGKFSAGFDLGVMSKGGEGMHSLLSSGARLAQRLLNFPAPVVLAVSGHALAMGALLLLSADYRIGVHGTYKIGLNEVAIGLAMPWFGVELARARLANRHLTAAVDLAHIYDAPGAVEAGYLDEAVSEEDLLSQAFAMAEQLSALDMEAYKLTKSRVHEHLNTALEKAFAREFGGARQ
ncbi:MAG: crotonase/enoyl-CoA hydratase family protein [Halioglobus sp.]|nr:crotonase/enoyl-CoA hydratase family protein [Halioglobus sp.]